MTRLSTSCGGRRPKSAKARSRGKWGTGGAAGAVQPRVRDLSAGEFFEGRIGPEGMHNFGVMAQVLLNGESRFLSPCDFGQTHLWLPLTLSLLPDAAAS